MKAGGRYNKEGPEGFLFSLHRTQLKICHNYLLYSVIDVQQHCLRKVFTIVASCEGEEEGWGQERRRRRGGDKRGGGGGGGVGTREEEEEEEGWGQEGRRRRGGDKRGVGGGGGVGTRGEEEEEGWGQEGRRRRRGGDKRGGGGGRRGEKDRRGGGKMGRGSYQMCNFSQGLYKVNGFSRFPELLADLACNQVISTRKKLKEALFSLISGETKKLSTSIHNLVNTTRGLSTCISPHYHELVVREDCH